MASAKNPGKKSGMVGMIIAMAALTILALAGGGLVGKLLVARFHAAAAPTTAAAAAVKAPPYSGGTEIKELAPIITNLASPAGTAVRLQVAVVFTKKPDENPTILGARIGDDFVAFLKTLSLSQLQGASGLQNLREDLNERAAIRSQGNVREVIIEALVTQ